MLKFVDFDIVFQEIPDEVTLAINLSNCPHQCAGCHSPQLQQNIGKELNEATLSDLLCRYEKSITCVCFMGGDATPDEVSRLADFVRQKWDRQIKTAWYSGCESLSKKTLANSFDFIKLGPYIESLGGLNSKTTNQRLYRIENDILNDITMLMKQ